VPMAAALRRFLAAPQAAQASEGVGRTPVSPPAPPAPAAAAGNGHPPRPLAAPILAALKQKRRTVAMTTPTLATAIGISVDELDAGLGGQPVPHQASERLASWAAAG
jgi:hypothetical protein